MPNQTETASGNTAKEHSALWRSAFSACIRLVDEADCHSRQMDWISVVCASRITRRLAATARIALASLPDTDGEGGIAEVRLAEACSGLTGDLTIRTIHRVTWSEEQCNVEGRLENPESNNNVKY